MESSVLLRNDLVFTGRSYFIELFWEVVGLSLFKKKPKGVALWYNFASFILEVVIPQAMAPDSHYIPWGTAGNRNATHSYAMRTGNFLL